MSLFTFYKLVAAGNDFVAIDNRHGVVVAPPALAPRLCHRQRGIGADGLLLLEASPSADFAMRIMNADGSEAAMCGNGARCLAYLAHAKWGFGVDQRIETQAGIISAHIQGVQMEGVQVAVELSAPQQFRQELTLAVNGTQHTAAFINTGVPHAVCFASDLATVDVARIGRALRYHSAFQPEGANVNFVAVQTTHAIRVRTYERGVEAETLACGTGATAAALVSALLGKTHSPVAVTTSGGETLTVTFQQTGTQLSHVTLTGAVHYVYEGKWDNV